MKRVLSLVLAVILVLGMMPVFADTAMTSGETLQGYGLIAGDENGDLNEGALLTRAEATVILARMNGAEEDAAAYPAAATFTDVDADYWAAPYISFAAAKGWVNGYPDGTFMGEANVTVQEFEVMMLNVLEADYTWDTGVEAVEITRGGAFDLMLATLSETPAGAEETLGAILEIPEYMTQEEVATELEVLSVVALNNAQFEITFNAEPDSDTLAVTVEDEDEDELTILDPEVDGTVAVVTFATPVDQQDEVTIYVEDAELNEVVMADYETTLEFLDTTLPTVESIEVVGINTIKVTFSEPVNGDYASAYADMIIDTDEDDEAASTLDKDSFDINDGALYIQKVELQNENTEAMIHVYSDLTAGDITVDVYSDVKDFAGFGVTPVEETITVVPDTTAPTVVGYTDASPTSVTLIWDEDITVESSDLDDFYHTNSNNPVDTMVTIDGNEMTFDFDTDNLPNGTAYVYVNEDAVANLWEIDNDQQFIEVAVTTDYTAPTVEEIEVDAEDTITIIFSEDIDADSFDDDSFTILDDDGEEAEDVKTAELTETDEITLTFDDILDGGIYSVVIEEVEDESENEIESTTVEFEITDLTSPVFKDDEDNEYGVVTLYTTEEDGKITDQFIVVDFQQEMLADDEEYSIDDIAKYKIGEVQLEDITDVEIDVIEDGTAVKITIPHEDQLDAEDKPVDGEDYLNVYDNDEDLVAMNSIVIARVADAAGNYTAAFESELTISMESFVGVESVEVTDEETLVITFDDELVEIDDDDFTIEALLPSEADEDVLVSTTLDKESFSVDLDDDGQTVVTFTFDDEPFNTDVYAQEVIVTIKDSATSHNVYDEVIASGTIDGADITDSYAPEVATMVDPSDEDDTVDNVVFVGTTTAGAIRITFTEALYSEYISYSSVSIDGDVGIDSVSVDGSVLVITLNAGDSDYDSDYIDDILDITVTFNEDDVQDLSGNEYDATSVDVEDSLDADA